MGPFRVLSGMKLEIPSRPTATLRHIYIHTALYVPKKKGPLGLNIGIKMFLIFSAEWYHTYLNYCNTYHNYSICLLRHIIYCNTVTTAGAFSGILGR